MTCRNSPTATACRRPAPMSSPATSAPTPSSRRSRPAVARRTAAPIQAMTAVPNANGAERATVDLIRSDAPKDAPNSAEMLQRLQATMSDDVGPLRTADKLQRALGTIGELTKALGDRPFGEAN